MLVCAVGCGGSETPAPPEASTTVPASTPSPSPAAPTKATDTAALKKAMVNAADLGQPWVVAKKVATTSNKTDEACPGQPSTVDTVTTVASQSRNLTEGKGLGVNIGTFHLGRRQAGGEAVLLLSVDEAVTPELLTKVRALPGVKTAMGLNF